MEYHLSLAPWTSVRGNAIDAEASEKSGRVSRIAALSRRCPIQDAADYWPPPDGQEGAVTGMSSSAPGQDSHNVGT
jgi:hypothetical protein